MGGGGTRCCRTSEKQRSKLEVALAASLLVASHCCALYCTVFLIGRVALLDHTLFPIVLKDILT